LNVNIPPAIAEMGPVLSEFFEAMVHKLTVNAHKDAIRDDDIDGLLARMAEEIQEFRDQRAENPEDPNMLSEMADVGNFAFLLFAFLRSKGVRDAREEFIDEYFTVDIARGRILCRKTRSGSPYRVGEEVQGTGNPVRIRTQHAVSGTTISLLRRDIVWWKANGEWPKIGLIYKRIGYYSPERVSAGKTVDSLDNLMSLFHPPEKNRLPFISQYKPKGREGSANFGKWIYQRRHAFELIRVGYWDSPEEAAREGIKAWKSKIRSKGNG